MHLFSLLLSISKQVKLRRYTYKQPEFTFSTIVFNTTCTILPHFQPVQHPLQSAFFVFSFQINGECNKIQFSESFTIIYHTFLLLFTFEAWKLGLLSCWLSVILHRTFSWTRAEASSPHHITRTGPGGKNMLSNNIVQNRIDKSGRTFTQNRANVGPILCQTHTTERKQEVL